MAAQLWELGIRHFATATLDEAVQLGRPASRGDPDPGIQRPCIFPPAGRARADPDRHLPDHAAQLETYCRENGVRLKVHIAVDTGMHRIGFLPEDLDAIRRVYENGVLQVTGIYSHLCVADTDEEEHVDFSRRQAETFKSVVESLQAGRGAGDGSPSEQLCGGELPGVRL